MLPVRCCLSFSSTLLFIVFIIIIVLSCLFYMLRFIICFSYVYSVHAPSFLFVFLLYYVCDCDVILLSYLGSFAWLFFLFHFYLFHLSVDLFFSFVWWGCPCGSPIVPLWICILLSQTPVLALVWSSFGYPPWAFPSTTRCSTPWRPWLNRHDPSCHPSTLWAPATVCSVLRVAE